MNYASLDLALAKVSEQFVFVQERLEARATWLDCRDFRCTKSRWSPLLTSL